MRKFMASLFKSSKKNAHKKGASFYHRENLLLTIQDFNEAISHFDNESIINTDLKIQIQGCFLENITPKIIKTIFGEEAYKLTDGLKFIQNHSIYYYRYSTHQFKFLTQLHFCDKDFFFAATKVYSDHILSDYEKQEIINSIKNKYCSYKDTINFKFDIIDKSGNLLSTYDDMYLYIRYIPNNDTVEFFKNKFKGYLKPKTGSSLKDDIDKLF